MKRRGLPRARWTPETVERFRECWRRRQRSLARLVARDLGLTTDAAIAGYYRFIAKDASPSPPRRPRTADCVPETPDTRTSQDGGTAPV